MHRSKYVLKLFFIALTCLLWAGFSASAHAYIGPAIAFVSYLFGPVVAVVVAIVMVIYLPIRLFLKKRKKAADKAAELSIAPASSQDNSAEKQG